MGHVYVVEDENGRVKIGRSINPEQRIKDISTTAGVKITKVFVSGDLRNYGNIENILLKKFRNEFSVGEWVNRPFDDVVKSANKLIPEIGIEYSGSDLIENYKDFEIPDEVLLAAYYEAKDKSDSIALQERSHFLLTINEGIAESICGVKTWKEAYMDVYKIIHEMANFLGEDRLNNEIKRIESVGNMLSPEEEKLTARVKKLISEQ